MARPKNCVNCQNPKTKCVCGRPSVVTQEVINKLEQAYIMGCTDIEACLYANISRTALNNYMKKNEDFKSRREMLKKNPALKARHNIYKSLEEGDLPTSKWFAEKTMDDFNPQKKMDVVGDINMNISSILNEVMESDDVVN